MPVPSCCDAARATRPSRTGASRPASTPPTTRSRQLLDARTIGLAGHSYGAAGVSYIGQWDPRVERDRRLGQPRPAVAGHERRPASRPARRTARRIPRTARPVTDHQAGARHVGRLPCRSPGRAAQPNECAPSPSATSSRADRTGVDKSLASLRTPSAASTPARSSSAAARTWTSRFIPNQAFGASLRGADLDRLVHDRLVRQVRQARPEPPTAACSPTAGATTPLEAGDRPRRRRQHVLLLLPLAAGHPRCRRDEGSTARTCAPGCAALSGDDGYPGDYAYATIDR